MKDPAGNTVNADDAARRFLHDYKSAVHARDVEAFVALYADDVRIFDLWGRWSCDGLADWRSTVAEWFGSLGTERVAVEWQDVRVLASTDLTVVHAFVTYTGLSADGVALRSMTNRVTWALVRRNDRWTIAHEHTSAPVNHETLKAMLQR